MRNDETSKGVLPFVPAFLMLVSIVLVAYALSSVWGTNRTYFENEASSSFYSLSSEWEFTVWEYEFHAVEITEGDRDEFGGKFSWRESSPLSLLEQYDLQGMKRIRVSGPLLMGAVSVQAASFLFSLIGRRRVTLWTQSLATAGLAVGTGLFAWGLTEFNADLRLLMGQDNIPALASPLWRIGLWLGLGASMSSIGAAVLLRRTNPFNLINWLAARFPKTRAPAAAATVVGGSTVDRAAPVKCPRCTTIFSAHSGFLPVCPSCGYGDGA